MNKYIVKILESSFISHDVKRIRVEKPDDYSFSPGQATEVAINRPGWDDKNRPFTFTNLPEEGYLEFMIKTYPSHKGVTNELLKVSEQDELILHKVFGTITYRGAGTFIAGGAGVTPFVAILRQLQKDDRITGHRLIFANKTRADIFLEQEFKTMLGNEFINILSEDETEEYQFGLLTESFLKYHVGSRAQIFYVCGPPPMMDMVLNGLSSAGVQENNIVKEEF